MWELHFVIMIVHLAFEYNRSYALLPEVRNREAKESGIRLIFTCTFLKKTDLDKECQARVK